ncbi:alpha/beta fold hydrolase [Burkholderia sp. Bp8998]|uniref:alpha/beta fold hydrolase n=1 Tax=Burkholderia sp. Bp8998 TaxID=2184557 RepID=UPI000F5A19DE|nr:alpha/beta hydrolase [Burkholderia sp. Bp8998]RQS12124.1 alpha/beta hydrolase [Burkholderia sp. Bp8998]
MRIPQTDVPPSPRRRDMMLAGATALESAALPAAASAVSPTRHSSATSAHHGVNAMNTITTNDGTLLYYKDWGTGRPVVFSHGWPLSADAWDAQMLFLVQHGFRVIAHDRRGHGRSSQPSQGNDMNTYADDLAALINALNLREATLVGHSTGGGEIARYIGRHGTERVAKAVLIGAVPPQMVKSESNPGGLSMAVFDGIRKNVAENRSQFYKELALPFFGFNRPSAKVSQGTIDGFWAQGMMGGAYGQYLCVKEFSEVDYTEDLKKVNVPTLILHGDDDQIVPIHDSAELSARIVKDARLKIIAGASHGMCVVNADQINAELLAFLQA